MCFRSSVSAQYPSAGKPSINLSTPRPTVSPFLFPLAFLPSFPFISHLTLSLPPLSYFIPVTYSQSHFRHYHTTLPPSNKKHACALSVPSAAVCALDHFFMLLGVHNLSILLYTLKTFKSSREKEHFRVTVTGFVSLTHTHTDTYTHTCTCAPRPFHPAKAISSTPGGTHWKELAEVSVIVAPLINAHLLLWLLSLTRPLSRHCTELQPAMHHS